MAQYRGMTCPSPEGICVGAAMINAFTHLDPDPRNPNPGTSLCPVACTWDKGGIRKLNPEHRARIARRQRPRELGAPLL